MPVPSVCKQTKTPPELNRFGRYTAPMKISTATLLLALSALFAMPCHAGKVLLSPGMTGEGGATANIGLARGWDQRWFESDTGYLSGYWHAGYTWWEGGRAGSAAHTLSVSPVFVYTFNTEGWRPFLEAGIGAALFTSQRVGDRNLGSPAHFEDRFGAGLHLGASDVLMLRVIHYSNAGLSRPNPGIESWSLVWGRSF